MFNKLTRQINLLTSFHGLSALILRSLGFFGKMLYIRSREEKNGVYGLLASLVIPPILIVPACR